MAEAVSASASPSGNNADGDQYQSDQLPFYDIVLVGEENVGKTSIYKRLENNTFHEGTISTLGVDNFDRTYKLKSGAQVQVRLWDTAGAERYRAMTRSYYKNAKAVVFVYSIDKSSSLTCLNFWIEDASAYAPRDALWVFVCNKIDLPGEDVSLCDADEAAFFDNQAGLLKGKDGRPPSLRWRTSAKTGEGVNEALAEVLNRVTDTKALKMASAEENGGVGGDQQESRNPLMPSVRLEAKPPAEKTCPC